MKMLNNNKGLELGGVWKYVGGFIAIVVLFTVASELYPTMSDAGDSLNESGMPLGSLFAAGGVVFVIIAAVILLAVIKFRS